GPAGSRRAACVYNNSVPGACRLAAQANSTSETRAMRIIAARVAVLLYFAGAIEGQEPPRPKLGAEESKLYGKSLTLSEAGTAHLNAGRFREAAERYKAALDLLQRLFPAAKYPDGEIMLAQTLSDLGLAHFRMGEEARGADLLKQSVAMYEKLYPKAKHPDG